MCTFSLMEQRTLGEQKMGDLAGVRVHKLRMVNQLALLAYMFDPDSETLALVALGSHENFYRDLK
jgi:mRNA interferase RelE/StbE